MSCHQRSSSLPCIPHATESRAEEELQSLKLLISSPAATIATMCDGLRRLGDTYISIEEIMCLPSNQVALSSPSQRRLVEDELERSLMVVDLCSAMKESLAEMKTSTQDLQLLLKRGEDDASLQLKVESFARLAKKAQRPFRKITSSSSKAAAMAASSGGCCRLLAEARETAMTLLESTSLMLPKQIASTKASRWWSLVSGRVQKTRAVCEEAQLRALERAMAGLESGAEVLFKRMIRSRVSLLNILSS